MKRSLLSRLTTGASAAVLAGTGLTAGPAAANVAIYEQPMLSYTDGWRVDRHVRELADVNGDGVQDPVGFGNDAAFVSHGRADSTFGPVSLKVAFFGSDAGWTESRCPRLVGDTHGDGREELIGFGHSATYVNLA